MTPEASAAWTVPPEQRPACPLDGHPCTSWTCLVDVCARPEPVCTCGWAAKVADRTAFDGTMTGHSDDCPARPVRVTDE